MSLSYNRVEINLQALQDNFLVIKDSVGQDVHILSMVKSAGYGHGLVAVAEAIAKVGGRFFGVAEVDEGIALRCAGVPGKIIVLLGSHHYDEIIEHDLSPVIFSDEALSELSIVASKREAQVGVHLKIDVGMGRLGIMPHQVEYFIEKIKELPNIYLAGVMGHFPAADDLGVAALTKSQYRLFGCLVEEQGAGLAEAAKEYDKPIFHIANSAAIINYPDTCLNMVRPGIALYGYHPAGMQLTDSTFLKPVMSFKSRVVQLKKVPADYGVSYGHLFTTKRPTMLAVLPVGYADGYLRNLTGKAEVLIRGKRAPVCGRICMNACLVDVTDIAGVQAGDEVVLMGSQEVGDGERQDMPIWADEIAGWLDTISYEVLCLFGNNNDRVYL